MVSTRPLYEPTRGGEVERERKREREREREKERERDSPHSLPSIASSDTRLTVSAIKHRKSPTAQ